MTTTQPRFEPVSKVVGGVRRTRVLLVDADLRTARRLAQMLVEDGYEVDVAGDGREALGRLEKGRRPDVILVDLMLRHMSGMAFVKQARAYVPGLPFIFVTGYPEFLQRALGADPAGPSDPMPHVFTKPVSYADLHSALGQVSRVA